ncbi:DNA polymerase III subunit delta [Candidatus Moranella endobia PCVAL]|uniref:DNA polymerase III subunit delta n=1 Tax=Moranella endobia (strain PCIT) TaxID=903503 RepID=F7XXG4_MOREP|nr:DNA polymerase III subunit delta [Candidatus Moranella endobia]AEI74790.1 DNA polymerase III, delta subunit [Candidatus Moranella endobia PCIT]AGJ61447.1 DNA polymerase III subunit delta [Candidatus Moranella endobia PCVAL]
MIRLYADQLGAQLQDSLCSCYLLFGNDQFLLRESQECIRNQAKSKQFNEHFRVTLDASTDWSFIFSLCQTRSMFANRQMLLFFLPDGVIPANMGKNMLQLASLLHDDLLLILRGSKWTSTLENSTWFKALSPHAVLVSCTTPAQRQLPGWVVKRATSMKMKLDNAACQLLCYCYEGNLLALDQALAQLSLMYPDGSMTLSRVEAVVNDAAHFQPFQLIDAVLSGKSKRAVHILCQLKLEAVDPTILVRMFQRLVLQSLTMKGKLQGANISNLCQNSQLLLTPQLELKRLTMLQLRDAVALMTKIELELKHNYDYPVWSELNALVLLLCGNKLPAAMCC